MMAQSWRRICHKCKYLFVLDHCLDEQAVGSAQHGGSSLTNERQTVNNAMCSPASPTIQRPGSITYPGTEKDLPIRPPPKAVCDVGFGGLSGHRLGGSPVLSELALPIS
jgi:hypothetical protein